MIPSEYDVGEASHAYAVASGAVAGRHRVIISAWENGDDADNLSCIALSPEGATALARALFRAADDAPPDWPERHAFSPLLKICLAKKSPPDLSGGLVSL